MTITITLTITLTMMRTITMMLTTSMSTKERNMNTRHLSSMYVIIR